MACPHCGAVGVAEVDGEGTVCTGCGWVLDATMALVDEGEKQTLTSGALVSQSTGTFVSVRDNGEGHLIYGGGIHSQIMSSAIRAKGRHDAMTRIFENVSPQLGLGAASRRRMVYIMEQVLTFLGDSTKRYKTEQKLRNEGMKGMETDEERKQRKGHDKKAREKELHRTSVLSRLPPLAGAIIYTVCREENKPVTLGTVAMAVGEGSYTVGKAFTQMKRHLSLGTQEIDPVLFVEPAVAKLKLPPQQHKALRNMAISILDYVADKEWVMEGRLRAGVALASVVLAANLAKLKIDAQLILHPDVKMRTVKDRVSELNKAMIRCADEYLPFPTGTVTSKNLPHYADQILQTMACMHNAKRDEVVRKLREDHARQELERQQAAAADATDQPPPSTLLISSQDEVAIEKKAKSQIGVLEPRSFARAEAARQRRKLKVIKAKQRLALMLKKSPKAMQVLGSTGEKIKAEGLVLPPALVPVKVKLEEDEQGQTYVAPSPGPQSAREETDRRRKRKSFKEEREPEERRPKKRKEDAENELDEEDMKIERCLLLGVSESLIVEGNYELGENLVQVLPPVSHSEEIDEADMPEEELQSYLLTNQERSRFADVKHHWMDTPSRSDGQEGSGEGNEAEGEEDPDENEREKENEDQDATSDEEY